MLPNMDGRESRQRNEMQKIMAGLDAKQLISLQTDQYLNITITKTGFDLIKHLASLFSDLYKQRLPKYLNNNQPMLSLANLLGKNITINNLHGLEVIFFLWI
jgi:methyltransferase-like protein